MKTYPIYREVRNGKARYRVDCGVDPKTGKRVRKNFHTEDDAKAFVESQKDNPTLTGEIYARRNEFGYLLDKLRPLNVTLEDAVNFYILHKAKNHAITCSGAIEKYVREKREEKLAAGYVKNTEAELTRFASYVSNGVVDVVTDDQVRAYIYGPRKNLGPVSMGNVLTALSSFFNWAIDRGYCSLNPVEKVKRPKPVEEAPSVISAAEMSAILQKCLVHGWKDRLAVHILVAFCGIRVEEAVKLNWSDVDLTKSLVTVAGAKAKKKRHRINPIPANALAWLNEVADRRRTGPIIGPSWKALMRATWSSCPNYRKNCIRHTFCSSWLAANGYNRINELAAIMGHMAGRTDVIYSNYRNLLTAEEGTAWFAIWPPSKPSASTKAETAPPREE